MIILLIKYKVLTLKCMDKPLIVCYWQEKMFFCALQENIKYIIYWLFQRISKKLKFENVIEYRRGLIVFGAKGLWQHLLYGRIRWRARWRKSCVLIGYPSTSCLLGISRVGSTGKNYFWPYNKSLIDQYTCLGKMAGYWPLSILRF